MELLIDIYKDAVSSVRSILGDGERYYYIMAFGCQQNEADSETMAGICRSMGYLPTADPYAASLILVNTCAIRAHAEDKALSFLGNLKHCKRERPDLVVGVTGCMAQESGTVERLKRDFHLVSFTLAPGMLHALPDAVLCAIREHKRSFTAAPERPEITEGLPIERTDPYRAKVSIMYGCNNFCSYCIVPYVRGRERSRSACDILAECRALIADGVKEITLLGQNVNSYRAELSFPELLEEIAKLEGEFWLRFMTSHPKDASDALIDVMARYPEKIAPAFHLPLQSGSDRILSLMNRTYTTARYLSIVDKLRAAIPDVAITTDIIVAFPSESEEDFEGTMDVVRRVRFDKIFPFVYSPREGTRAARMPLDFTREERVSRMDRLIALEKECSEEANLRYVGKTVRVLVESESREGGYLGRTATGKLVLFSYDGESPVGQFLDCRIDRATPHGLFGTVENQK